MGHVLNLLLRIAIKCVNVKMEKYSMMKDNVLTQKNVLALTHMIQIHVKNVCVIKKVKNPALKIQTVISVMMNGQNGVLVIATQRVKLDSEFPRPKLIITAKKKMKQDHVKKNASVHLITKHMKWMTSSIKQSVMNAHAERQIIHMKLNV